MLGLDSCCRPEQLLVGVGLSSFSYLNVPHSILELCAYQGYLGYGLPECNTSSFPAVSSTTPGAHSSIGADGVVGRSWDQIEADVAAGRAVQGSSNATRSVPPQNNRLE